MSHVFQFAYSFKERTSCTKSVTLVLGPAVVNANRETDDLQKYLL